LDTVALIMAMESPHRLSKRARTVFTPRYAREASALTLSEIAVKSRRKGFAISQAQVEQALDDLDIRVLPYSREHAMRLFALPWHHTDPFDRQILAQALAEDIPVVTSDEAFRRYEGVRVIW
jgi:PIN domain nuclease of toxin-antitoxin system